MKKSVLWVVLILLISGCEHESLGIIDGGSPGLEGSSQCIRHLNSSAEAGGDGLSWDSAFISFGDILENIGDELYDDDNKTCEIWVKGDLAEYDLNNSNGRLLGNKNLRVYYGFDGTEYDRNANYIKSYLNTDEHHLDTIAKVHRNQSADSHSAISVDPVNSESYLSMRKIGENPVPFAGGGGTTCSWTYDSQCSASGPIYSDHPIITNSNLYANIGFFRNNGVILYAGLTNTEAIWYNGSYFSWGYGGTWNRFADGIHIGGTASPPAGGLIVDGRVGMGTANPSSRLHLYGSGFYDPKIFLEATGNDNDPTINFRSSGTQKYVIGYDKSKNWFKIAQGGSILNRGLTMDSQGRVYIGGGNPSSFNAELSVKGKIRAEEIIVESGWADYVFEESYELKEIGEVEDFIKKNGHLPNIPSEEEVKTKGLSLGQTQKLMMEKIEELTLYTIEQNKRIIELEKKLAAAGE